MPSPAPTQGQSKCSSGFETELRFGLLGAFKKATHFGLLSLVCPLLQTLE